MMRPGRRFCGRYRLLGIIMMLLGLVLMMFIVPSWAWCGIFCAILIIAGFFIWRIC